jgi:hypothetical protein
MVTMDVEADLAEIRKPLPRTSWTPQAIEQLLTQSVYLENAGFGFEDRGDRLWTLTYKGQSYPVTFYPDVFNEKPSLRLMSFGEPLFEAIVQSVSDRTLKNAL